MGSKREFNRAAIKKNFLEQIFASGLEIEWIENSGELNFTVQYCIFCDMEYNVRAGSCIVLSKGGMSNCGVNVLHCQT